MRSGRADAGAGPSPRSSRRLASRAPVQPSSRRALPVRCRKTASRFGSSTSIELMPAAGAVDRPHDLGQRGAHVVGQHVDAAVVRHRLLDPRHGPRPTPRPPPGHPGRRSAGGRARRPARSARAACPRPSATPSSRMPTRSQRPLGLLHVVGGVEHGHALAGEASTLSRIALRLCGSTPTVGSSSTSSCGSFSMPRPMLSRRFMPPGERVGAFVPAVGEADRVEHAIDPASRSRPARP